MRRLAGGDCSSPRERDCVRPRQRPGMGPPIYSAPSRRRRSRALRAASPNSLSAEPLSAQLLSECRRRLAPPKAEIAMSTIAILAWRVCTAAIFFAPQATVLSLKLASLRHAFDDGSEGQVCGDNARQREPGERI